MILLEVNSEAFSPSYTYEKGHRHDPERIQTHAHWSAAYLAKETMNHTAHPCHQFTGESNGIMFLSLCHVACLHSAAT